MPDYREDPSYHYTPDEIRHAARAIQEAQPTLGLSDSVAYSLAYAALSTVPKLSDEEREFVANELRPEPKEKRAERLAAATQQDRALLAGVVDGVEAPPAQAAATGPDVLNSLLMQAVTGLPREEVDAYYREHPPSRPGASELTQARPDPVTEWQQPVCALLVGDQVLCGIGQWREALNGEVVTLKDGDRVLYWGDYRSGAYIVRAGDWDRAGDTVRQGSAWPVEQADPMGLPTFLSIEDLDAAELRITGTYKSQVAPILRKKGYAPVQASV